MSGRARRRNEGDSSGGESGDKAFWISFADLMTALMVLFMMVMAVALLSITRAQTAEASVTGRGNSPSGPASAPYLKAGAPAASAAQAAQDIREELAALAAMKDPAASAAQAAFSTASATAASAPATPQELAVKILMQQLAQAVDAAPGVQLDARRHVIDFGEQARFATGSHRLEAAAAQRLQAFVPKLLEITQSELGRRWVQRVVVEGFADPRGSYLMNLDLSLRRAESVLCALMTSGASSASLDAPQRNEVRRIFAVGGFSFNDQRESLDASRRIEFRIQFGPAPATTARASNESDVGVCRLQA